MKTGGTECEPVERLSWGFTGGQGRIKLSLAHPGLLLLGMVLLVLLPSGESVKQSVPRVQLSYKELVQSGSVSVFLSPTDGLHSHSVLLDEERGRLLLGTRDSVYLLDPDHLSRAPRKISWPAPRDRVEMCKLAGKSAHLECGNFVRVLHNYNHTHLYACGTGAFHPICAFIEISGHREEGVFQLLSGTVESGRLKCPYDPRQPFTSVLTDQFLYAGTASDFLGKDTTFTRSLGPPPDQHYIRTEISEDYWINEARFISAHPVSDTYNPDDDKIYFFFRESSRDRSDKSVLSRVARVCKCPSKTYDPRIKTTKDFSDEVVSFIRFHPLMFRSVYPLTGRPVFTRVRVDYALTQIVVDRVMAEDGQYEIMFLGTDAGSVLKVVSITQENWSTEEVILEELQVFQTPTPILSMEISSKQQQLYVGSGAGLAQVSLSRCHLYGQVCAECCLARDPYCAWDGHTCSRYIPASKRRARRQDIKHGDPSSQCWDTDDTLRGGRVEERIMFGVENNSTFLECLPKSQQATIRWFIHRPGAEHREEVRPDDRVVLTDRGFLIRSLHPSDAGVYECVAQEHTHFTHTLLRLTLRLIPYGHLDGRTKPSEDPSVEVRPGTESRQRYKDYLRVMSSPIGSLEDYCDSLWLEKRPTNRRGGRGQGAGKWKHIQELKKSRNRRHHGERGAERDKEKDGERVGQWRSG
ncbi:semaphorin-3D-like [Oncorhynchus masou masou]|uniref:semaphorin-3D-like n=1 Tax=Oncorhynchus masou masou TaxID=90313 RepID=UPI0031831A1A